MLLPGQLGVGLVDLGLLDAALLVLSDLALEELVRPAHLGHLGDPDWLRGAAVDLERTAATSP